MLKTAPDTMNLSEIVRLARQQASHQGTIIAFADLRYIEVLLNWLIALDVNGIGNYMVISLDRQLHQFLSERRIPAVLSEVDGDLGQLWVRRIEVFSALCAAGIDFIHSDVDAVWLRDPRKDFFSDGGPDLVISQGTVWPPDVHRQFGFVLCCGLFKLRSTPASRGLLSELRVHVGTTGDDQISLNRLIAQRTPRWQWESAAPFRVQGPGAEFLSAESTFLGACADGLRLAILPHRLFQRVPLESAEMPYVKHLLTPKEAGAKMREFAKRGCLFLRPDWRQVNFDASSLPLLRFETGRMQSYV
jgi:hypothetical protein